MKKIVLLLVWLFAISAPVMVEAQREYLSAEPAKDVDITFLMGNKFELPKEIFEKTSISINDDRDKTVTIQRNPYGQGGSISYPMRDGSHARDTDFNVQGLFEKMSQQLPDTNRKYILEGEFPLFLEDEDEDVSLPTTEPYIVLFYIGDGKFFAEGPLTPEWELGTNTIHLIVFVSKKEAKEIKALYDEAEKKAEHHFRKLENDEEDRGYIDPRNEYVKQVLSLLCRRTVT